jgi:hypothetical protein
MPERGKSPAEVIGQIGRAAGYRVHVWDAVENGDDNDSYFWKRVGGGADESESEGTFPTAAEAWRNCCEMNDLLVPLVRQIELAGCSIVRPRGFLACRWAGPDGHLSDESFPTPAEAIVACVLALTFIAEEEGAEAPHLCDSE